MFFEWSQQGKHKDIHFDSNKPYTYFLALKEGKRWAGIHWQMYEDGVIERTMPYYDLLKDEDDKPIPVEVVNQMKREMFKGADAEIIEKCYQKIKTDYEVHNK